MCQLFRMAQKKIKKIQTESTATATTNQQAVFGKNIQTSLAAKLQDVSGVFRKAQGAYLSKLRERETRSKDMYQANKPSPSPTQAGKDGEEEDEEDLDAVFTDAQLATLQNNDRAISEREKEITEIVKSINGLAEIFKELQTMVIDQGTVLDRVDYNIESTATYMADAHVQLEKASTYQEKTKAKLCIIFLGLTTTENMTAILSTDTLVIVTCKVCSKPVMHSSLLAHIDNCRRTFPTHALFQGENGAGDTKKTAKRKKAGDDGTPTAAKKDRKRKKDSNPRENSAIPASQGSAPLPLPPPPAPAAIKDEPHVKTESSHPPALPDAATPPDIQNPSVLPLPKKPRTTEPRERGAPKPKGPIDYDKHCAVMTETGTLCARSITCKIHSVALKRAVLERSKPYDVIMLEHHSSKSRGNAAAMAAGGGGSGSNANHATGAIDPITHLPIARKHSLNAGFPPMPPLTELQALELFDVIKYHRPEPLQREYGSSGIGPGGMVTLSGLLKSIAAVNVGNMFRDIREKRMGGGGVGAGMGGMACIQAKQE
ncbi:Syntaxin-16 [Podochytrium sp. JEL0797]|nr:Syntaxin-16 [Podochytrium sp. JEL0797]